MRLGFAVQVLGQPGLKSHDSRRWQNRPHLSVSLAYLRDTFVYLQQIDVHMYRMSSDLAPYITHPGMPQFHRQITDCDDELSAVGAIAVQDGLRLSFHPAAHVVLNAPDDEIARKAIADLDAQALLLDRMGLGPEAVIVLHVGGHYGDKRTAMQRFVTRYRGLSEPTRRHLVLENDDRTYTLGDTWAIHQQTGVRLVLDQLHYLYHPTTDMTLTEALHLALSTWPKDQTPKIHFSSPRTSMNTVETRDDAGNKLKKLREPRTTQHADLIDPFAFIELLHSVRGERDFDVMLECKAKDLALLRLRKHLDRLAPAAVATLKIT